MKAKPFTLRKKFFLSYLLVYVLPFFLLGLMFFYMTYTALKDNSQKTYQNMLDNAVNYVDNQVGQLSILTVQMSRLDWMNDIMNLPDSVHIQDRYTSDTLATYRQQIEAYLDANSFIEDIVIYFNGQNYCISSTDQGDLNWLLTNNLKIRDANKADWMHLLNSQNNDYIFPVVNSGIYGQVSSGLIFIKTIEAKNRNDGQIHATLIATIRRSVIEKYLSSLADKNGFVAWITNKSGKILVGESHMLGSNGFQPQAKNSLLFSAASSSLGLDFHAAAPKQVIFKGAYTAMDVGAGIALLLGIFGWVLSMKLAGRNYKPIEELMGFLQSQNKGQLPDCDSPSDEFSWLKYTIKDLLNHEDALKQRLEKYKPSLMELYLMKLVEGIDQNDQEFHKGLDLVGICFPNKIFCCGLIFSTLDSDRKDILDAIGEETAGSEIIYYAFSYQNKTVIVFNFDNAVSFDTIVKNFNYRCNAMKKEDSYLCFGSQGQYLTHIRKSYDEAAAAYEYRLISDDCCVIIYDEVCECDQSYYYPISQENILTNHLYNGEYQKAVEIFNEVIDENLKMNSLSPRALKNFFIDVELTVFKAAKDSGLGNLFTLDLQAMNKFNSAHDMAIYIKDIMLCFCKAVNKIELRHGHAKKEDIIQYLDSNITNPMLSLNVISSQFEMSPSYFSRYFQELVNCCFLDYVNTRRIEIAKKMIANNQSTINELCVSIGYSNDVTFRRIFKKYEGVSPTQYKELLKRKVIAR